MLLGDDRHKRILYVMKHVGGSVVNGAFSTFLGILPLAFASAEVFQTIFYIFAYCVGFGTFQGLCVLPIILSYIGPAPHNAHHAASAVVVAYAPTNNDFASV